MCCDSLCLFSVRWAGQSYWLQEDGLIADISQEERIVNICLSRNGLIPIATIDLLDECRSLNLIQSRFDTLIRSGFKSIKARSF